MWRAVVLVALVSGCGDARARTKEADAYDRYRRPDLLVAALALRPGQIVADVGAGQGYLTHRLAAAVGPRGRVVATDLDAAALAHIGGSAAGEASIETRRVQVEDPGLERGAYDLLLLAQVDHLLVDRAAYLRRATLALKPHGRIAVSNRRLYRAPLLDAARAAGLTVAAERAELPAHFVVLLEPQGGAP